MVMVPHSIYTSYLTITPICVSLPNCFHKVVAHSCIKFLCMLYFTLIRVSNVNLLNLVKILCRILEVFIIAKRDYTYKEMSTNFWLYSELYNMSRTDSVQFGGYEFKAKAILKQEQNWVCH